MPVAPTSARERLNYGLALLRAGQIPEGTAELLRVQQQDPKLPHTWFNLGIVYKKAGEAEKAIPQLERFTQLVPDDPIGHYNLAASTSLVDVPRTHSRSSSEHRSWILNRPRRTSSSTMRIAPADGRTMLAKNSRDFRKSRNVRKVQSSRKTSSGTHGRKSSTSHTTSHLRRPIQAQLLSTRSSVAGAAIGGMLLDTNGDGRLHVVTWSSDGIRVDGVPATQGVSNVEFAAAGDFNNDGLPDLAVITTTAPLC